MALERPQGVFEREDIDETSGPAHHFLAQGNPHHVPPSLSRSAPPGVIDEHVPDHTGADGEEVAPTLPARLRAFGQAEIRLVYDRRGVQRVFPLLSPQPTVRDAAQVVVNERDQSLERMLVTGIAGGQ